MFRHHRIPHTASRLDEPLAFYAMLTFLLLLAVLILVGSIRLIRRLYFTNRSERETAARALVIDFWRSAHNIDSLWLVLVIAVASWVLYGYLAA